MLKEYGILGLRPNPNVFPQCLTYVNVPSFSVLFQDAIGKHTLESCAYLAQTMLSQSCTGLSPMPDHHDTHFTGGMAHLHPPPHHHHHPGMGYFGYGPQSQSHSQSHLGTPGGTPPPPEQTVSSSGIPYTPQPSPAKQQQAEFQASSPVKGGPVPGSPAARSAYGSSPVRYPGTPPPKGDGYILPSPAKQLFPAETGGYQSGQYHSSSQQHRSDHDHHNNHHHMQGYGYGYYQQNAAQPSSSSAAAAGGYGNQYGSLV